MKIISWNVNGIRACARKGLLDFVQQEDPDILCLQESKAHPEDLDDAFVYFLERVSYWSVADRKGYSGTVTFTKQPVDEVEHGIGIKKFDHEGRFVITDHEDFLLFNVYFPNGSQTEARHLFKQEFLRKFSLYLHTLMKRQRDIIVVGDYNTAYLEHDVFDPKRLTHSSGFLPEERKWFENFLALGFTDCYRYFHPEKKDIYTWWSYKENARKNNRGWRIDHICTTSELTKKLKSADILPSQGGSDHCPVKIELTL